MAVGSSHFFFLKKITFLTRERFKYDQIPIKYDQSWQRILDIFKNWRLQYQLLSRQDPKLELQSYS